MGYTTLGDATTLPDDRFDPAIMTGNVAQVFVTDESWAATLMGIHAALRPDGWLVFETRDPARRAWEGTEARTRRRFRSADGRRVTTWTELTDVELPLVSFRRVVHVDDEAEPLISTSTLRFRTAGELARSLEEASFAVSEIRDAPDRPGRELVHLARRT